MNHPDPDPGAPQLLDHEYDGIREYDNPLPRWWVYLFYASIVWAGLYALNLPGIGIGKGRIANYDRDMAAAREKYGSTTAGAPVDEASLFAAVKEPSTLALGKTTFATNCAACHGPEAGGVIGPNLTDDSWLHGGHPKDILRTVSEGVLPKGMPPWGPVLKPEETRAVVAYVISLYGSHPANPKPPEGERAGAGGKHVSLGSP